MSANLMQMFMSRVSGWAFRCCWSPFWRCSAPRQPQCAAVPPSWAAGRCPARRRQCPRRRSPRPWAPTTTTECLNCHCCSTRPSARATCPMTTAWPGGVTPVWKIEVSAGRISRVDIMTVSGAVFSPHCFGVCHYPVFFFILHTSYWASSTKNALVKLLACLCLMTRQNSLMQSLKTFKICFEMIL